MALEQKFLEAVKKLRVREKKSTFDQTVDLIINLKEFDVRRSSFNIFVFLPHKIKDKRVMGFLDKKSKVVDTIVKDEFGRFKGKKDLKKLMRDYDFFIANAKLMPSVATTFGRILGPTGKMPSPQLGILANEDDKTIADLIKRINSTVRIRVKEASIKVGIAKESLKDEEISDNAIAVYNKVVENLPRNKDNVRDVKIKITMGKPIKVEI